MVISPLYLALFVVLGVFALGDIVGISTKSKLSSVFVALIVFLLLFMADIIPPDIVAQAQLTGIGMFAAPFLIFHMGTSISITQLRQEWKVLVLATVSVIAGLSGVLATTPIIGREAAIVSAPIVNGGIIATQILTGVAMEQGFTLAAALGTMIFVVQRFFGNIPASIAATREAKLLIAEYREKKMNGIDLLKEYNESETNISNSQKKLQLWKKLDKYWTSYVVLGVVAVFSLVASILGSLTPIPLSIWSLIFGVLSAQFGIVPPNILDKGKATGIFLVATLASLVPALADVTPASLFQLGFELLVVFAGAFLALYVIMLLLPTWKLIGSKNLTVGIAMSQFLAFPATFLVVNEVAIAISQNEDEKQYIIKKLTPAFVVSGFVSVTTLSVIVAGIFATIL